MAKITRRHLTKPSILKFLGYNRISIAFWINFVLRTWFVVFIFIMIQSCSFFPDSERFIERNNEKNKAALYNMQLGLAYLQMGNIPRAKNKLFTALHESPNSAEIHAALAFLLEKTGDARLAHQHYRKAIALANSKGSYYNSYGVFLCGQKDYIEAEKYFMLATKDKGYVYCAKSYENAGICELKAKHYVKAETYFQWALKQDSSLKKSKIGMQQLKKLRNKECTNGDCIRK